MPRIHRRGALIHPDDCDPKTGEPLYARAIATTSILAEAGISGGAGGWYVLPDGSKVHGRAKALAAATSA